MRTKKITKRTRWSRAIIRLMTKPMLLWLLVVLPLSGRACDMAVISDSNVDLTTNIGQVLRDAGGSVDINDTQTFFTVGAKINQWAKYKPIAYQKDFFNTKEEYLIAAKSSNFGFSIPTHSFSISSSGWIYSLPQGSESQPKRLGDFRGYNSQAICPMKVSWPNEATEIGVNTLTSSSLPYIRIWYRLDENTASPGMGNAEITLKDVNVSGVSTNTIGGYIACVLAYNSSLGSGLLAYRVANAKDTLDLRYGTSIADYIINLSDFSIIEAAISTSESSSYFPTGATNKRILKLYPKINKWTPSKLGEVYSTSKESSTTQPTTTPGGNGYVSPTVTNQFISIPQGTVLSLYLYEKVPVAISLGYISINNGSTILVTTWGFVNASSTPTSGIQNLGGKIINYGTQSVTVKIITTLYNLESNSDLLLKAGHVNDVRGIFPTYSLTATDTSTKQDITDSISIPKGGSRGVTFTVTYPAGIRSNYTFPNFTSPSFGTSRINITLQLWSSGGLGGEFTPTNYNNITKELRWR